MFCLACGYQLGRSGDQLCPECGRAFDPDQASTYAATPHGARQGRRAIIAFVSAGSVPLLANLFALASLVAARLALGRWPYRGGRDDPSGIGGGVEAFAWPAMLLLFASLPAALVVLILWTGLLLAPADRRLMRHRIAWGLFAVCLWVSGLVLLRSDPAHVWLWLFD